MSADLNQARAIKRQHLGHLLSRKNVVGVGVGYKECEGRQTDEMAVVVNVAQKVPAAQLAESDKVPSDLAGVKTDVVATGRFLAGQTDSNSSQTRARWRPTIPPGVSLGHVEVTAGTFGCLVRRGNEIFILSNNHVLANLNRGRPGDPIIQPARYDGGEAADRVATLAAYMPLDFGGDDADCRLATGLAEALNWAAEKFGSRHRLIAYRTSPGENLVDAALARPLDSVQFSPDILEIGRPKGTRQAALGMRLQKTGRSTGHTAGLITQIDATLSVDYNGRTATFTDQLIATGMSLGGDSGSAVLDEASYLVGLLFAGSGSASLLNPIQTVLDILQVEVVT